MTFKMAWFTQLFIFCLLATATMGTTASPKTTTASPKTTTTSPKTTSASPKTTSASPETTTASPKTTTASPKTTTASPKTTTTSPETTTTSPKTTSASPKTTSASPETTTASPKTTTASPKTTTTIHGTTETEMSTSPSGTTGAPTSPSTSSTGMTGAPPSPNTSPSGTTEATSAPSTGPPRPGPCASSPCPQDSSCVELSDSFTCVCRPGLFYNEELNTCSLVKTFPSELRLVDRAFEPEMSNKNSEIFRKTSKEIIAAFNEIYKNQPGYIGSTVLSLAQGSVIADVDSAFSTESDVSTTTVEDILKKATEEVNGFFSKVEVTVKDTCSRGFCDETTTTCVAKDGLSTCSCKSEYIKIDATGQACMACPSGEKAVDSTTCEPCSFGYSGFNCDNPYLLIVVIVSCVLGTLFLATLVAVIVVSSRRPKQSILSSEDSSAISEFNKPARIPRIPRANPDSGWQPANLETADSGSARALVTKDRPASIMMENYDAFNDYTRGQKNQSPSRTGYGNGNGYQARGVNNGSRGTRNPYYDEYDADDGGFRRY